MLSLSLVQIKVNSSPGLYLLSHRGRGCTVHAVRPHFYIGTKSITLWNIKDHNYSKCHFNCVCPHLLCYLHPPSFVFLMNTLRSTQFYTGNKFRINRLKMGDIFKCTMVTLTVEPNSSFQTQSRYEFTVLLIYTICEDNLKLIQT